MVIGPCDAISSLLYRLHNAIDLSSSPSPHQFFVGWKFTKISKGSQPYRYCLLCSKSICPPSPPRLDHLGCKFCDVYLLKSALTSVATKIRQKSVKNMSNLLQILKNFKLLFLIYVIPQQKMRPKNKENDDGIEILRCHDSLLHINPWFDISSSGPSWAEGFYFNTC